MTRLTERLREMAERHAATTEAMYDELHELQQDLSKLIQSTDQLLNELGDCDE